MMRAAVLGSPIKHSLSPILHESAYRILGIDGEYEAIEVKSCDLLTFFDNELSNSLESGARRGFNLTMPLKESVFEYVRCDFDALSSRIRSANTLLRNDDGFTATSTDATAFGRLLANHNVSRVAIIGGGGTARAAVAALADRSSQIDLLLRTPTRAHLIESIAPSAKVNVLGMNSPLTGYDLVINTTPIGAADHLSAGEGVGSGLLLESLYKPLPTELSFAWKELGGSVIDGIDLLVEQALDAIALMTEISFDYSELRSALQAVARKETNPQV
jgi:shikimate dehydrogenase